MKYQKKDDKIRINIRIIWFIIKNQNKFNFILCIIKKSFLFEFLYIKIYLK